ncbi:hypothetical protein C8R45DRAFT_1103186 [Mycena sanguinolenta]|nr:hypothetical protein C8R45DRAFT_1103186 [Mycena sanguinolenta]
MEIASATDAHIITSGWWRRPIAESWTEDGGAMRDVFGCELRLYKSISAASWFAQANYIFDRLQIVSNHEHYKLVEQIGFSLEIGEATENPPDGYLFVCSPKDFETSPMSFRCPDRPAYWFLDPSGSNPLSDEEAASLGFPSITRRSRVDMSFWDETVYAGLRKFDESKGFDPDGQALANELDYPLYEVCVSVSAGGSMESGSALDEDDGNDYISSHIEELTTADENFLEDFSCPDTIVAKYYSVGELAELAKFGLIIVLGIVALYEHTVVYF